MDWQPIETAPFNTPILVGNLEDGEWVYRAVIRRGDYDNYP